MQCAGAGTIKRIPMTEFEPAGFMRRFLAVLIDTIMFFLFITVPVTLTMGSVLIASNGEVNWLNVTLGYVLPFILTIWFWQKYLGTPGKMLLGIQVVDFNTGAKPSITKSVVRYFAYILSILPLFLGFIWIIFDKNKRGFHDYLSGTAVIRNMPEYVRR